MDGDEIDSTRQYPDVGNCAWRLLTSLSIAAGKKNIPSSTVTVVLAWILAELHLEIQCFVSLIECPKADVKPRTHSEVVKVGLYSRDFLFPILPPSHKHNRPATSTTGSAQDATSGFACGYFREYHQRAS